jgi:hypothetical protein
MPEWTSNPNEKVRQRIHAANRPALQTLAVEMPGEGLKVRDAAADVKIKTLVAYTKEAGKP